jgi:hypothetical protein
MLENVNIFYVLLLALFILLVLSMKKVMGIAKNSLWVAVASIIFPIVMSRVFGIDIPTDADSLLTFMFLGLVTYGLYILAKSIYTVLGMAEKSSKKFTEPLRERMLKKSAEKQKKLETKTQKEKEKHAHEEYKEVKEHIKKESKKKKKDEDEDYVEVNDE